MNKPADPIFAIRPTVTIELPLAEKTRILHPDMVILRLGANTRDLGAFCYAIRSEKRRNPGQPSEIVFGSFLKQRPKQILQLIKALSSLINDGGKRLSTAQAYLDRLISFLNWADASGLHDCLCGGDSTRHAYRAWVEATLDCYRRQECGAITHNQRIRYVRELLEATTGLEDLKRGTRNVKSPWNPNGGTDPLGQNDFGHAVALNQALFDGLCDLVLEQRPFPYKLLLPATLRWAENHLWLFPTHLWRLPPHLWGSEREKLTTPHWAYDYSAGRVVTPDEIAHRYAMWHYPSERQKVAKHAVAQAQALINAANANERDRIRIMLGMVAHNAFLFLFFCHTGANESVVREIETDGDIHTTTLNQKFRSVKFRAGSKPIKLIVPATFMPSLRRFVELRRWLLNGRVFPHLFFTLGTKNAKSPGQIGSGSLTSLYTSLLRKIDPGMPRMGSRKLRASVADWYQRNYGVLVTAKALQNSEKTAQKRYDAGSVTEHHEEMTRFLNAVSESAKRQRIISTNATLETQQLEEGGRCEDFGHPEALADHVPIKPNCRDSQGCIFCTRRVLIASEEDARKVASAAFVMEQVIIGPKHEEALRPLIAKCDEDLEKIAAFGNLRAMVERVRKDVFENANLTPYFADKFLLFLELGVTV